MDGAQILCPEIGNVVVCDNTFINIVDEVINVVSNMSKDLVLNFAINEASKPDLALRRLPNASVTSADAMVVEDIQSPILDGITTPVGCNNLVVLNSASVDVVLTVVNCSLNLMVSPSSGKDEEMLRDDSSEELALTVVPEGNSLVVCDVVTNVSSPAVLLDGHLVVVPVNLISSNALVAHVGGRSGDSVRLQTDWLKNYSSSSSEAKEV
ncbi:hypothetical protein MA16_Dca021511 [Dendrobium catenatum]|uniref:Uncharacterized protein n=1 Tax=Dendrobium catenatum TaxID=906689 RepID=A0A2I0VQD7_9ASPA|nr:hypothetical protein MA16_Dca021511 [Dendrobium catenatum]